MMRYSFLLAAILCSSAVMAEPFALYGGQAHAVQTHYASDGQDRGGLPTEDGEGQDRGGLPSRVEGQDRGGGAGVGLDFEATYKKALAELEKRHPEHYARALFMGLEARLPLIKVIATDQILIVEHQGVEQTCVAVNTRSTNLIQVNNKQWKEISNPIIRKGIALHEVLSLLGLESTGVYPITSEYLAAQGVSVEELDAVLHSKSLIYIKPRKRIGEDFQQT